MPESITKKETEMKNVAAILLLAAFLFVGPSLLKGQTEPETQEQADWTLMFYMDSDNNLESPQILFNLQALLNVGSTKNVNVVMLVSRSSKGEEEPGYTNKGIGGLPNWTDTKYLYVEKGKLRELGDWGKLNMGDPANLVKFATTAAAQFPAKKYGLIFGDHGGGWKQILSNESFEDNGLDMNKLSSALSKITPKIGKLELIGFDACMMGNFEVARTVSPYAKTMVGSEEVEPGLGWNYEQLLRGLESHPDMDGAFLGKLIVEVYRLLYTSPLAKHQGDGVTLSAIDLSKIDTLMAALSELAVRNQAYIKAGGRPALLKTAHARSMTEEYGKTKGKSDYKFFDIIDFAENLKAQSADPSLVKAADSVIAATKSAVIHKYSGKAFPHAGGLTIWFPSQKGEVEQENYAGFPFSVGLKWGILVTEYTSLINLDTSAPAVDDVATNDADMAKTDVATITAKVNGDDVDDVRFVLAEADENGATIIGAVPTAPDEKGVLHEEWDGQWFTIGDGTRQVVCPISDFQEVEEGKGNYFAEVPAQIRYKGRDDWRDVTLYFYLDYNKNELEGEFVYAFQSVKGQLREVTIGAGDSIRPVYIDINAKGVATEVAATDEHNILHITDAADLFVGRQRVAAGKYLMGFVVTDFAGNTSQKFTDVTIE
jgi:hypothetical protein